VSHRIEVAIRWRDMDAYGHVNNAVYLTYLEEARDRLVDALFGSEAWDFVLAHVGVDYRSQLTREDERVVVRCAVAGFGTSSVRTVERITKVDGTVAAEAESVIVPRDADGHVSRPLTQGERATLQAAIDADADAGAAL
jgi:acyl-CoA thioester hydrolase